MRDSSIVISMYNVRPEAIEVIDKLLMPSLLNNIDSGKQLILLDDASPLCKETSALVDKYRPDLERKLGDFKYLENDQNLGFSGSYNKGMKSSDGKAVMISNDDVYFPLQSIDSLFNVLNSHPDAGAVGPVTNYAYNFQNTRLFGRIRDYSAGELQRIEDFASELRKIMQDKTYESFGLIGFCLAFRKDVLEDVGYFDERYKHGLYEDSDLNRKIINSGRKIILDASTFVEHGGPDGGSMSIDINSLKGMKALFVNMFKYVTKWNDYSKITTGLIRSIRQSQDIGTITVDILKEAEKKNIKIK